MTETVDESISELNSQDHSQEENESFSSSNTSYNPQEVYVKENNGKIMALARQAKAYREWKSIERIQCNVFKSIWGGFIGR